MKKKFLCCSVFYDMLGSIFSSSIIVKRHIFVIISRMAEQLRKINFHK